jgi:hypothetical protein
VLRTNANGQLAILFADHTQVRLGRNSALQVKQMSATGDTVLNLQSGTMWGRAQRGGQGLTVETPAAAAAIRGTDWTLTVKGDQTSLIVLEGRVQLKNELGSVDVAQGEAAVATIAQADYRRPGRSRTDAVLSDASQRLHLHAGLASAPAEDAQRARTYRGKDAGSKECRGLALPG